MSVKEKTDISSRSEAYSGMTSTTVKFTQNEEHNRQSQASLPLDKNPANQCVSEEPKKNFHTLS